MLGVRICSYLAFIHIVLSLIEQVIFTSYGIEHIVMDYVAKVFEMLAQYFLVVEFLLISWGWTIKFVYIKDLSIWGPLFFFTILGKLMFMLGERQRINRENVFHHGSTEFGYAILFVWMLHYVSFVVSIANRIVK